AEEEGSESSVIDDGGMTYMGWIIDDFPCTVEQASVLEKCLSGYDETAHVPSRQDAASRLAPATPVLPETVEHKEILPSGIDLVIFIE
ncbi:unnamed protein product, partial [Sphacelaria rigidula]